MACGNIGPGFVIKDSCFQSSKSGLTDSEKREKKALEKKLSEMEEELKVHIDNSNCPPLSASSHVKMLSFYASPLSMELLSSVGFRTQINTLLVCHYLTSPAIRNQFSSGELLFPLVISQS